MSYGGRSLILFGKDTGFGRGLVILSNEEIISSGIDGMMSHSSAKGRIIVD